MLINTIKKIYKNPFNLNKKFGHNNCITDLQLEININKVVSPANVLLTKNFIYKLIKYIEITTQGNIIFQINGIFIKSKIELFLNKSGKKQFKYLENDETLMDLSKNNTSFILPLFLKNTLPLDGYNDNFLEILLNDKIFELGIEMDIFVCASLKSIDNLTNEFINKITLNSLQKINIESNKKVIKETIKFYGVLDYLCLYIDGDMEIDKIKLHANEYLLNEYSYNILNKLSPFIYLDDIIPSEFLFISFNLHGQGGFDASKIPTFDIEFQLKKNNGGVIYLMSESKNIEFYQGGIYGFKFSGSQLFDYDYNLDLIHYKTMTSNNNEYDDIEDYSLICVYI